MIRTDTLDYHLRHPHMSAGEYLVSRQMDLADSLQGRCKVYLDTKYWVLFRDVILGKKSEPALSSLLSWLREAVREQRVICPLSQDSFTEIFTQANSDSLAATLQVVDELSESVCFVEYLTRLDIEVQHFVAAVDKLPCGGYPVEGLVWTKAAYVLGYTKPSSEGLSEPLRTATEKAFIDYMWTATFQDMFGYLGCQPEWKAKPESVEKMNTGKAAANGDFSTFDDLLKLELAGMRDFLTQVCARSLYNVGLVLGGARAVPFIGPGQAPAHLLASLVCQFVLTDKLAREVPTLRADARLHAGLRWDRARTYKPNDLADVRHAAMALPYADVFLTERSLCHLVTKPQFGLSERFKCRTFFEAEPALEYLRANPK